MKEALEDVPSDAMELEPVPEDDFEGEFERWKIENAVL